MNTVKEYLASGVPQQEDPGSAPPPPVEPTDAPPSVQEDPTEGADSPAPKMRDSSSDFSRASHYS